MTKNPYLLFGICLLAYAVELSAEEPDYPLIPLSSTGSLLYQLEEEEITPTSAEEEKKLISGSLVGTYQDGFYREGTAVRLNQIWLTSLREADTSERFYNWGYQLDVMFGTTNTQCIGDGGFDGGWGRSGDNLGASFVQANVTAAAGPFSLTFGKMMTPLGYEMLDYSKRDLCSSSYMFYHESATYCGGLAQWQINDRLSCGFGLNTGADTSLENKYGDCGFLFIGSWTVSDRLSVTYAGNLNQVQSSPEERHMLLSYDYYTTLDGISIGSHDEYIQTIVIKSTLSDRLNYALVNNFGSMADWAKKQHRYGEYGIAHYFTYKISNTLKGAFRYEYFSQWLTDAGKNPQSTVSGEEHCQEISLGFVEQPNESILLRPEIRYDWVHQGDNQSGMTGCFACGYLF